jgi:hypothetical protein
MKRRFIPLLIITILLGMEPGLRAAPFRTELPFAFTANIRAGTYFWCVFPDVANAWRIALYERRPGVGGIGHAYVPLVVAGKPRGVGGNYLYQLMTVPAHARRRCVLVAFRNGVQQPYRGYTEYNPFGWHTFGLAPDQALAAQIRAGTRQQDIRNYERMMRQQLHFKLAP